VQKGQVQFATALYTQHLRWLLPFGNGAEVFNKDGTKCLLNEPRAVEALQLAAVLRLRHGVWRPVCFQGRATSFQGGTQATMHTGYWVTSTYRDQMQPLGLDFDVMPTPVFPGQPRVAGGWSSGHAIVASARQKSLTWELEKVVAGKEVYEILLERAVAQPVRKSQEQSPAYRKTTPPYSFDVPIDDARTARTPPFHTALLEVQRCRRSSWQRWRRATPGGRR
jgi:ABC-type glycerol-3-phosphate transport system substrate-binding protein